MNIPHIGQAQAVLSLVREVREALPALSALPRQVAKWLPWVAKSSTWPVIAGAYAAGIATGAGAALLFAPMTGKDLRKKMKERASELSKSVSRQAATVVGEKLTEVEAKLSEVEDSAAEVTRKVEDTLSTTGKVVSDTLSKAAQEANGVTTESDLEELTREELYGRAQDKDIPGRSNMNKGELVSALRASL